MKNKAYSDHVFTWSFYCIDNRKKGSNNMKNNNNPFPKRSYKASGRRKAFAKPCSYPGCPNLANGRFCDEHKGSEDRNRGTASQRGYDNRWRKYRKSFLEQHPLCVMCEREGDVKVATDRKSVV